MAKRPATDSGLPRREPGKALDAASEGVTHPHGDTEHLHRMGLIAHDHDDDGHVQFHTDTRFTPAGPIVSSLEEFTGDGTTVPAVPELVSRPDASEAVLGAAMGIINPAAEPGFAITHAEESARVLIVGQHVGNMFQAIADKRLVSADDVREVYRKMRQIAATHGLDLDGEG